PFSSGATQGQLGRERDDKAMYGRFCCVVTLERGSWGGISIDISHLRCSKKRTHALTSISRQPYSARSEVKSWSLREARHWVMLDGMKKKGAGFDAETLMDYDRWVKKHLDELVRKHPGKVVAV